MFQREESEAYLQEEPEASVNSLADGVHRVTIGDRSSVVLEGPENLVALDSFGTPGRARVYRRTLRKQFNEKPIEVIVYSHDHVDVSGFSSILADEAEIIADERTARVVEERGLTSQAPPDLTLSTDRAELQRAGHKFVLLHPGPTHGTGNRALYLPDEKILVMCDTLLPNARYGLLPDYHLGNFVSNMRSLETLDFKVFVPGRYETMTPEQFQEGCDYVEAVMETAQEAFAEGLPIWERETLEGYTIDVLGDRFGHLDGFENHVGLTALRAAHHFLMGGWGLEDTPGEGMNVERE